MEKPSLNNYLINACKRGDIEKVKWLLEQGANVHADNNYSLTISKCSFSAAQRKA